MHNAQCTCIHISCLLQNQFLLAALPAFVIARTLIARIRTHNVRSYESYLQKQMTLHRGVNRLLGHPVHTAGDASNTGVVSRSMVNIDVPLLGRLHAGRKAGRGMDAYDMHVKADDVVPMFPMNRVHVHVM